MIYSDSNIKRAVKFTKEIRISDFNEEQVNPNSYDVRLGNWFWKVLPAEKPSLCPRFEGPIFVPDGELLQLESGNTYLAVTKERVGTYLKVMATMHAKSSVRRNGISVCDDAGFGDVGFDNYWTMELTANIPVAYVTPGMKIAQLAFHSVGNVAGGYDGQYVSQESWKPEDMLPKRCRGNVC